MAQDLTNLDPEFWALGFDELDIGEYPAQNLVNRDAQARIAQSGDTVHVPVTPDLGDADDYDPKLDATASTTDLTAETVAVQLTQSKRKILKFTATELSIPPYDLITIYGVSALKTILRSVNDFICRSMLASSTIVDATSSFSEDSIIDIGTKLDNNEVASANRILMASPDDYGSMMKLAAFKNFYQSNDDSVIKRGLLGNKLGFNIAKNNIISRYTPADVAGAIDHGGSGSFAIAATQITVKSFADSSKPIRKGDVFTIAGDTTQYVVASTALSSGNTVTINILNPGGLVAAAADAAVVTIVPTRSMLAFVPNSFAFAARAYAAPSVGVGVKSSVFNYNGLPIRISVWMQGLLTFVQYDILYGGAVVNAKRIGRILR